ncbi:hypothetical protein NL676_019975 [Syzygium grande]|nr:hypothetical protein NL676_019975 [Syzygium grande]
MRHSAMAATRRRVSEDLAEVALEQARFCSSHDRQGELKRNGSDSRRMPCGFMSASGKSCCFGRSVLISYLVRIRVCCSYLAISFIPYLIFFYQGTYLTSTARTPAKDCSFHEGTIIGAFNGEFWGMFASHQVVGNLASLAVLREERMTFGTILMCFLRKRDSREERASPEYPASFHSSLVSLSKSVITPLFDVRMLLIIPPIAYSGLQQAFVCFQSCLSTSTSAILGFVFGAQREPGTSHNGKQVANREDALLLEVATLSQEKHFAAEASEHGKATFSSPSTDLLDTGNYAQGLQDMREFPSKENTSLPEPIAYKLRERIPDESDGIRESSRAESEGDVIGSFSDGSSSNALNYKGNIDTEFSAVAKEAKRTRPCRNNGQSATFSAINDKKQLANFSANEAKLENKIAMLEEELREAAAIEASLYSVVAEHGSSSNKGFEELKEEAIDLESKLVEAKASIKTLEDLLSAAQDDVLRLVEEKREIETNKENVEKELLKAIEEASSQASNFTEACALKKSIEEALLQAENDVNALTNEKEAAQVFRAAAERELEKLKEEISIQTGKLADAQETIKSLEDASLELEKKVGLLTEQNHNLEVWRSHMETELKKLQDESATKEIKLADVSVTIKSLEDAVSKAENNALELENQNKRYNQEVSTLNSKLNACLEELAGKNGSLESRSLELVSYLNEFHALVKNEMLYPLMKDCFEKKWECLKSMNDILERVKDQHISLHSEAAEKQTVDEDDPITKKQFPVELSNSLGIEMEAGLMNEVGEDISSLFRRTIEGFRFKNKILVDKFGGFSAFIDEILAALLKKLEERCDDMKAMSRDMISLKQDMKDMETYKLEHGNTVAMLEDDIATLLSACTDATTKLLLEVERNSLGQLSSAELETSGRSYGEERESSIINAEWYQKKVDGSKHAKPIRDLLFSVQNVQALLKQFQSTSEVATSKIQNLENELKEAKAVSLEAIEDGDMKQNRVFELETEVETLQNSCGELRLKLKDCQADYDKLKEREVELLEVHSNSLMKEQEAESSFMSPSQRTALLDKVDGVRISSEELGGDTEPQISPHVKKLFYIVDSFTRAQEQISLLSHDNQELQSTLADQVLENKHLREEVETHTRYAEDSEKMKRDLLELRVILERITNMFGGSELVSDHNTSSLKGLLASLEKQIVNVLMEFENSKSEAQELEMKLLGSQKVVEELSSKVKLLEDSLQGRSTQPEIIQERGIFEAPLLPAAGSEISEVEDVGSVGKPVMPPVPSAAHARTMRKGSADHLALSIDLESNPLISNQETDEDKGHVFKSLNTSGLIPKQGKLVADRIDGIWVSGGRILMSRPGARLGLIAYWLFLHLWLLGTIL